MCVNFKELIGETIESWKVSQDRETITLNMLSGKIFELRTYGDCCSQSWIESIDGEDALTGTISAVDHIEMPNLGNIDGVYHQGVDVVEYYGLRITTNKGRSVIDYRNDSNGYYGGSIYLYTIKG